MTALAESPVVTPDSPSRPADLLTVTKLGEHLGARVDGVRLSADLDAETVEAIRAVIATHKAVIFTGQQHLDDDAQYAFAALLGTPTKAHPTVLSRGEDLLPLEGAANSWHTDVTFVDRIPKISVLRPTVRPSYGGATMWASTVAAYAALPLPLRALADQLRAVHSNDYDYAEHLTVGDSSDAAYRAEFSKTVFRTEHPVVRVHPETGERALTLGHFVQSFSGFKTSETADLLRLLQARIERPDNTFRWNWNDGDVAIWDNRSTQHYGVADFGKQFRRVNRVTLAGDVPVGVDRVRSTSLEGDASGYSIVETPRSLVGWEPASDASVTGFLAGGGL
ncbi:MAG: TauD/TfdA family dioxygenase [Gordonia sp.]|jgi:taurine dioxygenase|uniref:TauD/TfdA dioxygenase family protein n=1 Tax=Williamsia sp. 1138 TaxID=1903117 RepID=UPI000A10D4F1|nr:TauD/TfdA family dioxygenase [Williamsia sp. 1138]MBA4022051.1 TauD/TfdA family dioxygenase [Gordonia sp. (in: high G+C Gram-positive bacteria)]OZG27010.1 taurine catabolism dioxygenase [Williamsia sp. 1138]